VETWFGAVLRCSQKLEVKSHQCVVSFYFGGMGSWRDDPPIIHVAIAFKSGIVLTHAVLGYCPLSLVASVGSCPLTPIPRGGIRSQTRGTSGIVEHTITLTRCLRVSAADGTSEQAILPAKASADVAENLALIQ
jgi:hypothetical protein